MTFFWIAVFIVSLFVLIRGSNWLLQSSEKIGLAIGLSPFIVGVVIVGVGTSTPELISSLVAVLSGASEIVAANVVGSNIANILLIVGVAALLSRRLAVSKNLIDLDLPLLALSTAIFAMTAYDGLITIFESIFLIITYVVYLGFSLIYKDTGSDEPHEIKAIQASRPTVTAKDILQLVFGIVGLAVGAKYLVDSVISLSELFNIGTGIIAITAVAIGTSLPELIVSVRAALSHQSEVALGNIFGSNIFNALFVVGLPGLWGTIVVDEKTLILGLPVMIVATVLFVISGISRRIHTQEGAMFVLLYIIFIAKLFNLF